MQLCYAFAQVSQIYKSGKSVNAGKVPTTSNLAQNQTSGFLNIMNICDRLCSLLN
jgi:hypothetical protein